jgi:hypothetical protein
LPARSNAAIARSSGLTARLEAKGLIIDEQPADAEQPAESRYQCGRS